MGNYIEGLILVDTETGKKYRIPMEGTQLVAGPYDMEFEAEIQIYELLDTRYLEEITEENWHRNSVRIET